MKLIAFLIVLGSVTFISTTVQADSEATYNQACMACHMTGAAGAPIRGNAEHWEPRVEKGMDTLYDHAINGFQAMPPKGGQMGLSDDEVKEAVDYMLKPVL
ncbi:c-type cytochrome [Vreelandella salicampi]|uniref:Cytochrome c5 family protein n=1 Tax=Vreelandella salicampi TaxID=1449798 RepID=A0A7Z0RU28_9GAMM|nr:c-type cytochrome [Halomonas salicampi]NYS60127.1 cytochrome c5 family protein [Halomonas salicampi]